MTRTKVLFAGLAAAVLLGGCGQKKDQAADDFSRMPVLAEEEPASQEGTDIFDEFYESTPQQPAAKVDRAWREPVSSGYRPEFVEGGRYVVQVSTVASRRLADDNAAKLQAKGYPAYVAEVQNPTPELIGTYYRIRIAAFTGVSKARQFGNEALVPEGYEFWVDNRANDHVGIQGYGLGRGASAPDYGSGGYTAGYPATSTETQWESPAPAAPAQPAADSWSAPPPPAEPVAETPPPPPPPPADELSADEAPPAQTPAADPQSQTPPAGDPWGDDGWGDSDW